MSPASAGPTPEPKPGGRRTHSRSSRAARGVFITLAALSIVGQLALIAGAGWAAANPRAISDAITVSQYNPTPAVSGYATRAAMSDRGRFLLYASAPQVVAGDAFDGFCSRDEPDIGVLGCYTLADGRIYLYDIANVDLDDFEVVVAAHEMLHAAWDRMSADEQRALGDPLEDAVATIDPQGELAQRIAAYEEADPASRIPELYAIVGTELAVVPDMLEVHYATYFDDRAIVVALWQKVEGIFAQLDQELNRLSSELARLATQISAEQGAAEQTAATLETDITAFNERASQPGGYATQSAFERDRQVLIERQAVLTAAIDATNALVDDYTTVLAQFTELNDEAEAINRDLNLDPQPIEATEPTDSTA